jgi:uncharacterized protein (DUF1330 family)
MYYNTTRVIVLVGGEPMTDPVLATPEQSALLAQLPLEQPVVMINLLQFKPGGAAHYERYAREVGPHLAAVGARALYAGVDPAVLIGEGPRPWWDAILVVEYPSPTAFVEMVTDEAYAEVHAHRAAAIERAELIATNAWQLQT